MENQTSHFLRNLMRIKFLISSHFSLCGCKDVFSGLGSPWLTGISLLYKGNPEVAGRSWPGPTLPLLPWGAPGIPSPSPIPAPPRLEPSRPIGEGVVLEPTHKYDSAMWRLPGTLRTVLRLAGLGPQPEVPVLWGNVFHKPDDTSQACRAILLARP